MVQPDTPRVRGRAADGIHEGLEARGAQLPWVEGRHAPVLSVAEEVIRWSPHPHPGRHEVLPAPRVEPVRREADGNVGDQVDLAGGAGQLLVDVELDPLVERDSRGQLALHAADPVTARMPERVRPGPPGSAVDLGERVERGEAAKCPALALDPAREAGGIGPRLEDQLKRLQLQAEDGVVVDGPVSIQRQAGFTQRCDLVPAALGALDLLDPQVQEVAEPPR